MRKQIEDTTTRVKALYLEKKKYQPYIAFLSGFIWDSITLTRIDRFFDNLIMLSYVMLAGLFIYLEQLSQNGMIKKPFLIKYHSWIPNIIQFFLGSLFSGYLVYYFQSASITNNWLFLLLLIVLLVSNEFFEGYISSFITKFILYFWAVFSFFIFYLPILLGSVESYIFLLSGLVSVLFVAGLAWFIYKKSSTQNPFEIKKILISIGVTYFLFNLLYFTNIIPPVPLSVKDAGMYHSVKRIGSEYHLKFEEGSWYEPFKQSDETFHYVNGDTVFCFTSIFAPSDLNTKIFHHWQFYSPEKEAWVTTDKRAYTISGGRDAGFRGYTYKRNIKAGSWRVSVRNSREQILGRISFEIVKVKQAVNLQKSIR